MFNVSGTPEAGDAQTVKRQNKKTIADFEQDLKAARAKLALAKREFHDQSVRNRIRRERYTGEIVLRMIDEKKLDASIIALIRAEVGASCRNPKQIAAFRGSILE